MFNPQTQERPNTNVNTNNVLRLQSDESKLTVSAWNRLLSIELAKRDGDTDDGTRAYMTANQGGTVKTSLSADNVVSLLHCVDKLKASMEKGEAKTYSVTIHPINAAPKIFTLGYDGQITFLEIGWDVREDGTVDPENRLRYPFGSREVEEDYDFTTGQYIPCHIESEFERFVNELDMSKFLGPEISHGIRYDNAIRAAYSNNRNIGRNQYNNSYNNSGNYNRNTYGGNSSFVTVDNVSEDDIPFN